MQAGGSDASRMPASSSTSSMGGQMDQQQTRAGSNALEHPRSLPDRNVTASTISDAYIAFIFYCNPAVPSTTDIFNLREAFQAPPKSGGKSFSTFVLFELIKQLDSKELKTWAELALKLGVEPPDQGKGDSSQKIQQYAVRLKRWMHSMHVNAFFDYLVGNEHPYWTQIPQGPNPICEEGRDGVAAEDDMALRALLPHIRPRRGRRKPEDDGLNPSPAQRPRMGDSSFPSDGQQPTSRAGHLTPWSAHPDGRNVNERPAFLFPPNEGPTSSLPRAPESAYPWNDDDSRPPMSAFPQSAMTPTGAGGFWGEPNSAVTPSRSKPLIRRHGAKVVSSAWRSGAANSGGKTRGRPPMHKMTEPLSALPDGNRDRFKFDSRQFDRTMPTSAATTPLSGSPADRHSNTPPSDRNNTQSPSPAAAHTSAPAPVSMPTSAPSLPAFPTSIQAYVNPSNRANRPSGLSLKVPERKGGPVRLATPPPPPPPTAIPMMAPPEMVASPSPPPPPPPPVVQVNGEDHYRPPILAHMQNIQNLQHTQNTGSNDREHHNPQRTRAEQDDDDPPKEWTSYPFDEGGNGNFHFEFDDSDTTNRTEVESLFVAEMLAADWIDTDGQRLPGPPALDEALALIRTCTRTLMSRALTKEAALINLTALAGCNFLLHDRKTTVRRVVVNDTETQYELAWQLRYGSVRGNFSMSETVPHAHWKKKEDENGTDSDRQQHGSDGHPDIVGGPIPVGGDAAVQYWRDAYQDLLRVNKTRIVRSIEMRRDMLDFLKPMRGEHDRGVGPSQPRK